MILTSSNLGDVEQLTEWIKHDPYHEDMLNPTWWLTGNGLLSYVIQDLKGPTMYVRTDQDGTNLRIHTQFAPESEVSKIRVIKSIIFALPKMELLAKQNKLTGMIYMSTSQALIQFMQIKFGFIAVGNDDYSLPFEELNVRT
jgi:hypothetical protein